MHRIDRGGLWRRHLTAGFPFWGNPPTVAICRRKHTAFAAAFCIKKRGGGVFFYKSSCNLVRLWYNYFGDFS